jgi:hypothetical protein
MNNKQIEKLINVLFAVSSVAILVGAFFQLQHYPYGYQIMMFGFFSNIGLSGYEIKRLRKINKGLDQNS